MAKTTIYRWDGGFEALRSYDGQRITILRPLTEEEADIFEVGPMFLARFEDGTTNHVYADEIEEV